MSDYLRCDWCSVEFRRGGKHDPQGRVFCSKQCCCVANNWDPANVTWGSRTSGSSCFITTAVCEAHGLPDDCTELTTLRGFRDTYMESTPSGRALVELYYATAPALVTRINARADKNDLYAHLRNTFIVPAVAAVSRGENEKAQRVYHDMMDWLNERVRG